jgi:hypothetical protein
MSTDTTRSAHPGEITFVDPDGSSRVRSAADVPDTIAWAEGPDGQPRPVTRIEASMRGQQRLIRSFGADGALLASTVQQRPSPRQ